MMKPLWHPDSDGLWLGELTHRQADAGAVAVDPCDLPAGTRIKTTLYRSEVLASMDFETYSEAGFSIDPHTGKVKGLGPQGKGGLPVVGTPV